MLSTPTIWLRISSVVSLVFAVGHALGGLKYWSPMGDNAVLQSMRATRFATMGTNRSYFEFFMGFGHLLTVSQVVQAILLWQLAALIGTDPLSVRPMIAVIALGTLAGGVLSWRFLFPIPALFCILLLATLAIAWRMAH